MYAGFYWGERSVLSSLENARKENMSMDTFIANGQILVMSFWQKKQHSTQALGMKAFAANHNALAKLFSPLNLGLFA
ncbi:MAG: hypothetical protein COA78_04165 [Blastopirellula sp.]|nr:MAG: hypothetical protein COA78_04165 [Blastopirellula sp.]